MPTVKSRRQMLHMDSIITDSFLVESLSPVVYHSRLLFEYYFSAPHPSILNYKYYDHSLNKLIPTYDYRHLNSPEDNYGLHKPIEADPKDSLFSEIIHRALNISSNTAASILTFYVV